MPTSLFRLIAPILLLATFTSQAFAQYNSPQRVHASALPPDSVVIIAASQSMGSGSASASQTLQLQTFEDNFVGHVNDSDDEGFMEFKLSVVHQFDFFNALVNRRTNANHFLTLNFAFTGRFAQYIATRTSSPVVGKRFNPYLFLGYDFKNHMNRELRLGYGHESNGQSVIDPATYTALANSLVPSKRGPDVHRQALDYISRGWDYASLTWSDHINDNNSGAHNKWAYELALRRYLQWGFLQGDKEEYQKWENAWGDSELSRNDVSGAAAALEYDPDYAILGFNQLRLSRLKVMGCTGNNLSSFMKRGGGKATAVINLFGVPLTASYAYGYDGDIAQFGKINHSWALGVTLNSFMQPMAPLALTGGGLN